MNNKMPCQTQLSLLKTNGRPLLGRRKFLLGLGGIACAGCKVGPDFKSPHTRFDLHIPYDQKSHGHSPDGTAAGASQWWAHFHDPLLSNLIVDASRANLGLSEAYQRIIAARARTGIARSQFFPQLTATADNNYKRFSQNSLQTPTSNGGGDFMSWANGFDSSWEIDLFGKLARGLESAQAEYLSEVEAYNDLMVSLCADIATNYFQARILQQRLLIARENLALQQRTLSIVEARQEAGLVVQLDRSEAQSNVAVTSASIPPIEQELQIVLYRLAVLIGQRPGAWFTLEQGFGQLPTFVAQVVETGIPAELLQRRPDICKAHFDVMSANAKIGIAQAERLPQLTIRGTISVEARDLDVLYTGNSLSHSVGPGFRWNVLNFGRLKRGIEQREAEHLQALIRFENAVLVAIQEVESALVEFAKQKEKVAEFEKVVAATTQSVEVSMVRYEQNLITFDRVLDAQRSLATAQGNLASARGEVLVAIVKIYKSLGGGW